MASHCSIVRWGPFTRVLGDRTYSRGRVLEGNSSSSARSNGNWSSWAWDGRQLSASTSSGPHPPLYYAATKSRLAIGTSSSQVSELTKKKQLCPSGIAQVLLFGHCLGNRTIFKEVYSLPPGSDYCWKAGRSSLHIDPRQPVQVDCSLNDAVNRFVQLLNTAVKRRMPYGRYAMGLSGGRDSRHILLILLRNGWKPRQIYSSHHYLNFSGSEIALCRQLSARLGLSPEIILPNSCRITAELLKNKALDHQTLSHSWGLELGEVLSEYTETYDGISAGVLYGRTGLSQLVRKELPDYRPEVQDIEAIVLQQCERVKQTVEQVVTPELFKLFDFEDAQNVFSTELHKYSRYPNIAQAYLYFNQTVRDTALFSFQLNRSDHVLCPFDDIDLVDFALALPWSVSSKPGFQEMSIKHDFPEHQDIDFTDGRSASPWTGLDVQKEQHTMNLLQRHIFKAPFFAKTKNHNMSLREIQIACYCSLIAELSRHL